MKHVKRFKRGDAVRIDFPDGEHWGFGTVIGLVMDDPLVSIWIVLLENERGHLPWTEWNALALPNGYLSPIEEKETEEGK